MHTECFVFFRAPLASHKVTSLLWWLCQCQCQLQFFPARVFFIAFRDELVSCFLGIPTLLLSVL